MLIKRTQAAIACSAIALVALTHTSISAANLRRQTITLRMKVPAVVRLANTSVGFKGDASNAEYRSILQSLETTLETQLVSNERTLVMKPAAEAQWVVNLTVTGYSNPGPTKRAQRQIDGTTITYSRWRGTLNVAYQVLEKSGKVHDAGNVPALYDNEFQDGLSAADEKLGQMMPWGNKTKGPKPTSQEDIKQILVRDVVAQVASKLSNTEQAIDVPVAGGDPRLDRAATFLDQRLWQRAIEEIEKIPAFPKASDESYRQYDLGLCYEAMSYDSQRYEDQRNNLFKAQEFYDKAADMNQSEKRFVEVVARTRNSVARYRQLDGMRQQDLQSANGSAGGAVPSPGIPPPPSPGQKPLTLDEVIKMAKAGVPEEQIIEIIDASPAGYELNTPDAAVAIANAKLSRPIQNALRARKGMPPLATPAGNRPQ